MIRTSLYDKIISVTLYKPPVITKPGFVVYNINSPYRARTYEYLKQESKEYTASLSRTTYALEFYEGFTRKVFIGSYIRSDGKEMYRYRTIRASGRLYNYNTVADAQRGVRPDGSPLCTGDRVRIKATGTVWTVYAKGSPSEAFEEAEFSQASESITIAATDSGLKPDMSLSINLLPGQNCYGAVLKIRNFNLDAVTIRHYNKMVIKAGYRTGYTTIYTCPIFSSYIESPNPDGVTVFEGITIGTAGDATTDQFIEIVFRQEKMKLIDMIRDVAQGISSSITVVTVLPDYIMNEEITISKQVVYAQNGLAILNWLQNTVSQFVSTISAISGTPMSVFLQLDGDELQILVLNGPNQRMKDLKGVISLDMVEGATFNGTALTVVAPWNPELHPGNLFFMPPNFLNGSKLPNALPVADYRNEANLYRALTMSVNFASVESVNQMTVLAVPAQWSSQLPTSKSTEMTADVYANTLGALIPKEPHIVEVGKEDITPTTPKEVQQIPKEGKNMFDKSHSILVQWGSWKALKIPEGSNMSTILEYYLTEDPQGPRLRNGKGIGQQTCYYRNEEYFKQQGNVKAVDHFQNTGISANVVWWPLTTVGTYWKKWEDDSHNVSNNWTPIKPNNPNFIHAGYSLYVPTFPTTWEEGETRFKIIRDIWKYAYKEYGNEGEKLVWRAMYYYMGGDDIERD